MTRYTDAEILAARSSKPRLDPSKPFDCFVEKERTASGSIEDVATIFLVNKECPFRCTMCDLWKYTLDERVPVGAIPAQIDQALERLPAAKHVKLYNAGNFFDAQAIPPEDHAAIAARVRHFDSVIVENHPRLTNDGCLRFRDLLGTRLEIALGLETVHPDVLTLLNKRMTLADFDRAAAYLVQHDIDVRAFILLRPPGLSEREGINWAVKSVAHAFALGAQCCSVIPTRAGNGFLDRLQASGEFAAPAIRSLSEALDRGIALGQGRVFVDLWNSESFGDCPKCDRQRIERLRRMNLSQRIEPRVECDCERVEHEGSVAASPLPS